MDAGLWALLREGLLLWNPCPAVSVRGLVVPSSVIPWIRVLAALPEEHSGLQLPASLRRRWVQVGGVLGVEVDLFGVGGIGSWWNMHRRKTPRPWVTWIQ